MPRPNKIGFVKSERVECFDERATGEWDKTIDARTADPSTTISIYEPIGEDFFGDGFTEKRLDAALRAIGNKDITININSLGGDYYVGGTIFNRLLQHPGKITVQILGTAASAASLIAMAGDEILMAPNATMMIHSARVIDRGNWREKLEVVEWLRDKIDAGMASVYAARSGKTVEEIDAMFAEGDTFFLGQEALDAGFATGLLDESRITSRADAKDNQSPAVMAKRKIERLVSGSIPRSEVRKLLNTISDTPGAVVNATHDAGEYPMSEMSSLLETLRN